MEENKFKCFLRIFDNSNSDVAINYYTSLEEAKEDYKKLFIKKGYSVSLHQIPQKRV
tara:strand:- start:1187 stop:1357 length:171 start_codon:yes stop_codon:yes gene_type:complete